MAMVGMDVAQVRQLAVQLSSAAQAVRDIQGELAAALSDTSWVGSDRARFEGQWHDTAARSLRAAAAALDDAAMVAKQNADQHEAAGA